MSEAGKGPHEKLFVRADDLLRDSFELAAAIHKSGYRPEILLVLWRGGTPVGVAVHEFLLYKGIVTYHTAVKAMSYVGIDQRIEPRVEHLEPVLEDIRPGQRVLIIDDIFDTGCTVRHVRDRLRPRTSEIRVATLYYKPGNNRTDIVPDFYLRETNRWIVFPHELVDLTAEDIRTKDPRLVELLG
jgi:hypoxanthine phosphoribosyltransferase